MSTYIVGDIQGCLDSLKQLLDQVNFDPAQDHLWAVGDIVNRGPDSLNTLRFLKNLAGHFKMVLGNHDLHLLAVAYNQKKTKKGDTLDDILLAPDRHELIDWLRQQPLLYKYENKLMVHAGIPHIWSTEKAMLLANEVTSVLQSDDCAEFLSHMYGNQPDAWSDQLQGMERLRVITNYLTRMRVCNGDGRLNLDFKKSPNEAPKNFRPWFDYYPAPSFNSHDIYFGHWAMLPCKTYHRHFHALDSGCIWGNKLTMIRTEDNFRIDTSAN